MFIFAPIKKPMYNQKRKILIHIIHQLHYHVMKHLNKIRVFTFVLMLMAGDCAQPSRRRMPLSLNQTQPPQI